MKKISKTQLIAILITTVISITLAVIINYNTPQVRIAFTQPEPTEQCYEVLKDYALGIAKGQYLDSYEQPKELKIDGPKIEGEVLKVNIETSQLYGVKAEFPIRYEVKTDLKTGIIEMQGTILYEEATYWEYTEVYGKFQYILLDLLSVAIFVIIVYTVISEIERKVKKK